MKQQALTLLSCIMIAMSITGFAYAQWNDVIVISNTMTFGHWGAPDMGFVDTPTCVDNEATKDVGEYDCYYTDHKIGETGMDAYNTTIITINNGYPGYEVHCNLTLKNIGLPSLHINETVISDPTGALTWDPAQGALVDAEGKPIITIVITPEVVCNNLSSGEELEFELAVHITENAEECHEYTFQVKIMYEEAT